MPRSRGTPADIRQDAISFAYDRCLCARPAAAKFWQPQLRQRPPRCASDAASTCTTGRSSAAVGWSDATLAACFARSRVRRQLSRRCFERQPLQSRRPAGIGKSQSLQAFFLTVIVITTAPDRSDRESKCVSHGCCSHRHFLALLRPKYLSREKKDYLPWELVPPPIRPCVPSEDPFPKTVSPRPA